VIMIIRLQIGVEWRKWEKWVSSLSSIEYFCTPVYCH